MPCLTGRYTPQLGLITNMGLAPVGSATPNAPAPTSIFPALIDTGASNTCISPQVAQALNLKPIGLRPMTSATGINPVNVYLVDLVFPFGNVGFVKPGAQVMEFAAPQGNPFQILLGRDIICTGVLTLSFDGHFSFSL